MPHEEERNLQFVRSYLDALGSGAGGEELRQFFVPDAVQIEFPSRLNPDGGRSVSRAV